MSASTRTGPITRRLVGAGVTVSAALPDSWLGPLIAEVEAEESIRHVSVVREDDGVGICAGASLMGARSVLLCQNAGLLLATNALAGYGLHHQIPFVVIAADRGGAGDNFYYQAYKHSVTYDVMSAVGLRVYRVQSSSDSEIFETAFDEAEMTQHPVVLLCTKRVLAGFEE